MLKQLFLDRSLSCSDARLSVAHECSAYERLEVYKKTTAPLLNLFSDREKKGTVIHRKIDAGKSIPEVKAQVQKLFKD